MEIISKLDKNFDVKNFGEYKTNLLKSEVFQIVEEKMHSAPKDLSDFFSVLYEAYKNGDSEQQLCLLQYTPLLIRSSFLQDEYYGSLLCIYNVEAKSRREAPNESKEYTIQVNEKEKFTQEFPDYDNLQFFSDLKPGAKTIILRVILQVYQKNLEKLPKESIVAFTKVVYELCSLGMPFEIPKSNSKEKFSIDKIKYKQTKDQKIFLHSTVLNEMVNIIKYLVFKYPSDEVYEACYAIYVKSTYEQQEDCLLNITSLLNLINF